MALKTFNPTSAGRRHLIQVDRSQLWKGKPVKALVEGQNNHGGRGNSGRITSRRKGGGHKTAYRLVDFRRTKHDVAATVERLEYDPNRTAFIALIKYADGEQSYILAPQRLAVGDAVIAGKSVDVKPGNAMPLGAMPVGTIVHNVEMKAGKGGSLGSRRWHLRHGRRPRPGLRAAEAEVGRNPHGQLRLHGVDRCGVEPRSHERSGRQGRPQPLEGLPPGIARHRAQPGRPPERRPYQRRQALGNTLGPADQGQEDPQEQVNPEVHRAFAP